MTGNGVRRLILVRHGQSLGNVAADNADRSGSASIDIDSRDADVPLSETGEQQAAALGKALGELPADRRPDAVWCSPYRRAHDTAALALQAADLDLKQQVDERLRDRDLGVLDLLTLRGISEQLPDEAKRREWLGKFYYRPPGGESWTDLALRIRGVLADLDRMEGDRTVLVVCHDVVVLIFRYVCEAMTEQSVLELGKAKPVLNTAMTTLARDADGRWVVEADNDVSHLEQADVDQTGRPGDPDVER